MSMQVKIALLQLMDGFELGSKWKLVMDKQREWLLATALTTTAVAATARKPSKAASHLAFLSLSVLLDLKIIKPHECVKLLNSRKNLNRTNGCT